MKILRFIKLLFLALVLLALVFLFFANRETVTLNLMPQGIADALSIRNAWNVSLFVVVAAALLVGIVVGFILEWLREHRFRAEARTQRRKAKELEREVVAVKGRKSESQDDVLAILEDADTAR
ncbi:LapA family protein [Gymnodinialimonas sp. 57CJ19]|uniref:LapA family protein n=1 Tax=Gymnodinialimonas sp. 57CJ19 TaxID=3138498 RepID=UPI003134634E